MPVATGSRRRGRRDPSSEDIEEEAASQNRAEDVDDNTMDMDEDDQPRRSGRAKKERETAQIGAEAPEADATDDDPLKNFGDAPLDRNHLEKLKGLASDWSMARTHIHVPAYGVVNDVATSVAEFEEGEKSQKMMEGMDKLMRELINTEHELSAHETVLKDLHQSVARGEEISDILDRYERELQQERDKYNKKTVRGKYAQNEHYLKFRQAIWEVQNPDTAMPPVTDFLPREQDEESDDDDDVQVGGVTQDYKCPLTLTVLVEPLTSSVCGHSFSAAAIREFLGPNKNTQKKCPASGCNQMFCQNDLMVNKELEKKARDAARRERMRDDDSDNEVVE